MPEYLWAFEENTIYIAKLDRLKKDGFL